MIVDFHVHTAPSLLPRHDDDRSVRQKLAAAGVGTYVLKAHEGSTAERAVLAANGAVGSMVLNSPVGGANPDAVSVAAAFGARVVWLPTVSSEAHRSARSTAELGVHQSLDFRPVPVCADQEIRDEWHDVFDVIAANNMVLASGHVSMDEAIVAFRAARQHGVDRLVVTHPLMSFLGWREEHIDELVSLGVYLEVGVLADLNSPNGTTATARLAASYPTSLMVFGSDLGHSDHPTVEAGISAWLGETETLIGGATVELITDKNGRELLRR
jgi:Family of unknown function (DUF6282)